jgi:hypothetical protein
MHVLLIGHFVGSFAPTVPRHRRAVSLPACPCACTIECSGIARQWSIINHLQQSRLQGQTASSYQSFIKMGAGQRVALVTGANKGIGLAIGIVLSV